jgi:hypothetical protein
MNHADACQPIERFYPDVAGIATIDRGTRDLEAGFVGAAGGVL